MSVLDAIGGPPLIRLRRVTAGLSTPVYVKAEFLNPGMSVKDRAALGMVRAAERDGSLRPGGAIVEGTSGNTGVGSRTSRPGWAPAARSVARVRT